MDFTTRTFRARYLVIVETAVLSAHDYRLTFTGYGAAIQITLDGVRCSKAVAEAITKLALNLGTFERLSGPSLTPVIGNALACKLHRDMGRLGIGGGHSIASEALERPVSSLAALTLEEARATWSLACSLAELPTQPSILFAVVA